MADDFQLKNLPDLSTLKKVAERYPKAKIEPENVEVLLLLNRVNSDAFNFFRKDFDSNGLTSARFALLMRLRRAPLEPLNPSDLSDFLGVTRATVSGLLDGLEKSGLIKRVNSVDDKRCCLAQLTKKGTKLIDKIGPEYFSRVSALLAGLKKSEIKTLKKILLALAHELQSQK